MDGQDILWTQRRFVYSIGVVLGIQKRPPLPEAELYCLWNVADVAMSKAGGGESKKPNIYYDRDLDIYLTLLAALCSLSAQKKEAIGGFKHGYLAKDEKGNQGQPLHYNCICRFSRICVSMAGCLLKLGGKCTCSCLLSMSASCVLSGLHISCQTTNTVAEFSC